MSASVEKPRRRDAVAHHRPTHAFSSTPAISVLRPEVVFGRPATEPPPTVLCTTRQPQSQPPAQVEQDYAASLPLPRVMSASTYGNINEHFSLPTPAQFVTKSIASRLFARKKEPTPLDDSSQAAHRLIPTSAELLAVAPRTKANRDVCRWHGDKYCPTHYAPSRAAGRKDRQGLDERGAGVGGQLWPPTPQDPEAVGAPAVPALNLHALHRFNPPCVGCACERCLLAAAQPGAPRDADPGPLRSIAATWAGHASFVVSVDGLTMITDPMWTTKIGPFSASNAQYRYDTTMNAGCDHESRVIRDDYAPGDSDAEDGGDVERDPAGKPPPAKPRPGCIGGLVDSALFRHGPSRRQPPRIPLSELPFLDVIFLTHDHYDHTDTTALVALIRHNHNPLRLRQLRKVAATQRAEYVPPAPGQHDSGAPHHHSPAPVPSGDKPTHPLIVVPMGTKTRWWTSLRSEVPEIDMSSIVELMWWDTADLGEAAAAHRTRFEKRYNAIFTTPAPPSNSTAPPPPPPASQPRCLATAVPAQHWGLRSATDRDTKLWCGFVVRTLPPALHASHAAAATPLTDPQIRRDFASWYVTGDTGFDNRIFDSIGAAFADPRTDAPAPGPYYPSLIDVAFIPIGSYTPRQYLYQQHIGPVEAAEIHFGSARPAAASRTPLLPKHSIAQHWGVMACGEPPLEPPELLAFASWLKLLAEGADSGGGPAVGALENGYTSRLLASAAAADGSGAEDVIARRHITEIAAHICRKVGYRPLLTTEGVLDLFSPVGDDAPTPAIAASRDADLASLPDRALGLQVLHARLRDDPYVSDCVAWLYRRTCAHLGTTQKRDLLTSLVPLTNGSFDANGNDPAAVTNATAANARDKRFHFSDVSIPYLPASRPFRALRLGESWVIPK